VPATLPRTGNGNLILDVELIGAGVLMLVAGLALAYVSRRNAV
jgi:hypothetical protein